MRTRVRVRVRVLRVCVRACVFWKGGEGGRCRGLMSVVGGVVGGVSGGGRGGGACVRVFVCPFAYVCARTRAYVCAWCIIMSPTTAQHLAAAGGSPASSPSSSSSSLPAAIFLAIALFDVLRFVVLTVARHGAHLCHLRQAPAATLLGARSAGRDVPALPGRPNLDGETSIQLATTTLT